MAKIFGACSPIVRCRAVISVKATMNPIVWIAAGDVVSLQAAAGRCALGVFIRRDALR